MKTKNRFAGVLSEEYDMVHVMIPHYDEHQDTVREAIAAYTENIRKDKLCTLEIGCGTGFTSARILEADPRIKLLAIDNESVMVRQAEVALARFSDRLTLEEGDALAILRNLPKESMDIVASGCVIHNLPCSYRQGLMDEVDRVLVSGGLFVNADKFGLDDSMWHAQALKEQLANLFEFDKIGRPDLREAWHAHYLEDEKINFTEREQKGYLWYHRFDSMQTIYRKRLEATIVAIKS
jgi:ubiquinone/menaquinone biosynthesis C-methylase UbiE